MPLLVGITVIGTDNLAVRGRNRLKKVRRVRPNSSIVIPCAVCRIKSNNVMHEKNESKGACIEIRE